MDNTVDGYWSDDYYYTDGDSIADFSDTASLYDDGWYDPFYQFHYNLLSKMMMDAVAQDRMAGKQLCIQ